MYAAATPAWKEQTEELVLCEREDGEVDGDVLADDSWDKAVECLIDHFRSGKRR